MRMLHRHKKLTRTEKRDLVIRLTQARITCDVDAELVLLREMDDADPADLADAGLWLSVVMTEFADSRARMATTAGYLHQLLSAPGGDS